MATADTSDPSNFFGSEPYFEGTHRLDAAGYSYEDALIIRHEQTGIKMWACAFDLREDPEHRGLRDGDKVLYHYTDEASFFLITNLGGARIWANPDVNNTDSFFGLGVYATAKAPHQWRSKDAVRLNNFYPTRQNFRTWSGQELPEPEDADFEALLNGTVGDYVNAKYPSKTDYCIPLIVDQEVSKNAMAEVTDGPLMRNRRKRLAGYNSEGEKQPAWRDVWVVSVYSQTQDIRIQVEDAKLTSPGIVRILEKRLPRDPDVQRLVKYGLKNYGHIQKNLLAKVIEHNPADVHAYINLGRLLRADETIEVQLREESRKFSRKELYLKAIELDNDNALAYNNLGNFLSADDKIEVQLREGPKTFTKKKLYLKAIELDNGNAFAYTKLFCLLSADEKIEVQLRQGPKTFTKKELYLTAIELDNDQRDAYTAIRGHLIAQR